MGKINKLTPEQEALLPVFRERAIKFALSGNDEIDDAKFHKGVSFIYTLAKLNKPIALHVDSPLGIQFACHFFRHLTADQVWDQVGDQVGDQVREYTTPAWMGVGYDSGWVEFYKVFTAIGLLKHNLFDQYAEFVSSGIWDMVLFQGVAIGCRRPCFVTRDAENRLHNDNRSSIAWRDGFELYYLDGVHLAKDIWQRIVSQNMTFDEIVAIEDADVRAVALKYNKNAIIASGAELIDEHPQFGELFLIKDKQINTLLEERELYFMRMQCPTGRTFVECVDPSFAKKNPYILNCQANAFGVPVEIYQNLQARNEG